MRTLSFLQELKRRHVVRVGLAYAAVAFVLAQGADLIVPALGLDERVQSVFVLMLLIGFPISLVLAWAFQITRQGIARDRGLPTTSDDAPPAASTRPRDSRSIAALPFTNLSEDRENEHFADGITDEILTRLSGIAGLRVISRTSVMRYKNTTEPLSRIASELGVSNILEGSVRRVGNRVRVTAQLIEAESDTHLWAESYERDLTDVFAVQSDVATKIAGALSVRMTAAEARRLGKIPTRDLEAYDLFLKGRNAIATSDPRAVYAAIEYFRQAVARDPDFAQAHATLAQTVMVAPYWAGARPADVREEARAEIDRALVLDPELAEAHAADAAWRTQFEFDWERGGASYARALELSPSSSLTWIWLAAFEAQNGRLQEALRAGDRAVALDPFSSYCVQQRASYLTFLGRLAEAISELQELIARDPGYSTAHWSLGFVYLLQGDLERAKPSLERSIALSGGLPLFIAGYAGALVRSGRRDEGVALHQQLLERARKAWVDPFALYASAYSCGDVTAAVAHLEQAEAERSFFFPFIRLLITTDQRGFYDALAAEPRVQAMLRRVWPTAYAAGQTPLAGSREATPVEVSS